MQNRSAFHPCFIRSLYNNKTFYYVVSVLCAPILVPFGVLYSSIS